MENTDESVFCVRARATLSQPGADPPLAQEPLPSVPLTVDSGWLLAAGEKNPR